MAAAGEEVSWGECQADGGLAMPSCKDDNVSYRRLRLLGQGSFGKAFLARDLATNDLCVMKQVRVEKMDAKARDTAVREAVALRRVRHPNVVRFRQVFVRSGWLCLVMDFADGGDLCAAVKERARSKVPFEECAVLECFAQVADAVSYVHLQKMVHRDIKSRNIFLCRTGKALLGDFGLVRLLESTCELAHTRVGTPYYLSPEIIRKQPYNYKTDVWSLGVLLYEMAALQRPFAGTLETLPKVILKGTYEPLGSHYGKGLHDLVAGMLQVEPSARIDLAEALRGEVLGPPLQRSREALGLEAPPPPDSGPKAKRSDRLRETIQKDAEKHKSEWIGYNTMIRKSSDGPLLPSGQAAPEPAVPEEDGEDGPPEDPVSDAIAAHVAGQGGAGRSVLLSASMCPENWSTAQQRDANSEEEDLESVSSDSWGSVVEGDINVLQQAVASEKARAADS
mmetsp:Transcript_104606/g.263373  ORF Transcript_104606/g.263373 Transcript_104606/m.263373 type:complete len:451 (+) Transcript_104606:99-1451(+)